MKQPFAWVRRVSETLKSQDEIP
ncbi:MAG: hypothetical protein RL235_342, partial [Chlamydiota bacterium]